MLSDPEELVTAASARPSQSYQLAGMFDDDATLLAARYADAAATAKLKQPPRPSTPRRPRSAVFVLTPSTAARSLAGGRRP
jgi:hypothetical protein